MASLKAIAHEVIDDVREGIAWIALWRDGRSWGAETFYPDYDSTDDPLRFDADDQVQIRKIVAIDPRAILVNSYYDNLGPMDEATLETVADALRWQYDRQGCLAADYI